MSPYFAMKRKQDAIRRRAAIQTFMAATGLRPASWARRAGISPNGIYNFLNGRSDSLSQRVLEALALAAGRPISQIIGESIAPRDTLRPPGQTEFSGAPAPVPPSRQPTEETHLRSDVVMIPLFDTPISAGNGFLNDKENQSGTWPLARAYVGQYLGIRSPVGLVAVEVRGDSMEPTLRSGDRVIVDTHDRLPSPAGIFVLWDGLGTVIKRVEHIQGSDPTTFHIISDNSLHRSYELRAEEAHIVGRVICLTRRL